MMRIGMSVLVPLAARKASRIIADSKATATDISSRLGVSRDRIDVIHLGGLPPGPATDVTE
jgi:hypothetical protein